MSERDEPTPVERKQARSERRRKRTREEILDAARKVLLRDGFSEFSTGSVARELGLTKPALYYYFASREALVSELVLREWIEAAVAVQAAVELTETGVAAIEALMRTVFYRYRDRLDLFKMAHVVWLSGGVENVLGPDDLQRVRPVNGMLYGGAEARLRADQARGACNPARHPRRLAFTAHMAVIGILNMKAMAATTNDPLIHSDDELINDICQTFRDAIAAGEQP